MSSEAHFRVVFENGRKKLRFTALDRDPSLRRKSRRKVVAPPVISCIVKGHPGPPPGPGKEWREWYFKKYLLSEAWQQKRNLVMNRAGYACEECSQKQAVQVHHLRYDRVGYEELSDLRAVCAGCHQRLHQR